jgi:hypothetical protein
MTTKIDPFLVLKIVKFIIELILGGMKKGDAIKTASRTFNVPTDIISKFKGL